MVTLNDKRRPPPKTAIGLPGIPPPRARLRSHDNVEAVLAQEAHEKRQAELLAQLTAERERAAQLESELRKRMQTPARVESIAPDTDEVFRVKDLRIRNLKAIGALLTTLAAIGVIGSVKKWGPAESPRPAAVVERPATAVLEERIAKLETTVAAQRRAILAQEAWTAAVLSEAAEVKIFRDEKSQAMPALELRRHPNRKPRPHMTIDTVQPTIANPPSPRSD